LLTAWSILIEEKAGGACFLHLVEDFLEEVWTIEEEDEDGYVYVGRMFHVLPNKYFFKNGLIRKISEMRRQKAMTMMPMPTARTMSMTKLGW
jgi:hypothetical protein